VWALGGFYLTLGPSLAAQLLDSRNLLWGGILIFLLTGVAGAASTLLGKRSASGVLLGGCLALIVGALLTLTAIETDMQAVLFLGTAVTGLGFGPAFMGAYRVTIALAPPNDRASLIAAIYIVSYLATGIPAVVGGIATSQYGLHKTALVYLAAVAALAVVAVIPLIRRMASKTAIRGNNQPDAPPGAGTVPPCPPIEPRLAEAKA
jgi:predicted MFS family arabinose efflux permease